MKLCFYTPPFPRIKSYYEIIDVAAEYGLNAVEGFCCFELANPDKDAAKRIKEYAENKNIIFPCFSVFTKFASGTENVEKLKKYADVAKILGSPYLHHTIVGEFADSKKVLPYKEQLTKSGIEAVREVYDYGASIGIKTIYEEQGYIFNGIKGFGELINAVERDIGVVADFGNIYESEDDLLDFLKVYADKVVHAHIKDVYLTDINTDSRGLESLSGKYMYDASIGTGIVNFKEAIKILKEAGYNGYYGLEFSVKDDNSPVIAESINLIKSWM